MKKTDQPEEHEHLDDDRNLHSSRRNSGAALTGPHEVVRVESLV